MRIVTDEYILNATVGALRSAGHDVVVVRDVLGEVYTVLAYYHEHPEEMRELRGRIGECVREHRKEAIMGPEDLPEELRPDGEPSQRLEYFGRYIQYKTRH